ATGQESARVQDPIQCFVECVPKLIDVPRVAWQNIEIMWPLSMKHDVVPVDGIGHGHRLSNHLRRQDIMALVPQGGRSRGKRLKVCHFSGKMCRRMHTDMTTVQALAKGRHVVPIAVRKTDREVTLNPRNRLVGYHQ